MIYKRFLIISLSVFFILFVLGGCKNRADETDVNKQAVASEEDKKHVLSYNSAEELEEALNNGEDVTGAMATFNAGITSPGPNGYYMYAGKKLAFVSNDHPNINPGSSVTVKIKTFKNIEGTWNIEYER